MIDAFPRNGNTGCVMQEVLVILAGLIILVELYRLVRLF